MEIQNLLVGALSYLVKFQSTQCPSAKERALMIFEVLSEQKGLNADIKKLCCEVNDLLAT